MAALGGMPRVSRRWLRKTPLSPPSGLFRAASYLSHLLTPPASRRKLATNPKETEALEAYWEKNKANGTTAPQPLKDTPLSSPSVGFKDSQPGKGHARNRSASDGAALVPPGHRLSPFHPAWSLTTLLDTFGPLIFPIHRAALLRKRILISGHAPVREVCNFG